MKILLIFGLMTLTFWQLASCQTKKSVKTIFTSIQKDTATELNQTKIYKLKKKTINSNFDYSKLVNIDGNIKDTVNLKNLMPIFEPISGNYNYYQFIATFKGQGHDFQEVEEYFHDILIIKTDNDNKIIDAYQYTLEWADPPLQFDLYKSDIKNLTLKTDLDISALKLTRTYFWDEKDRIHKESGRLKLE
jgi:hypothetical protein